MYGTSTSISPSWLASVQARSGISRKKKPPSDIVKSHESLNGTSEDFLEPAQPSPSMVKVWLINCGGWRVGALRALLLARLSYK